jgi:iron only hydrogenase large subunit-like protein
MACIGGCIGGSSCLTHGEKNRVEVEKHGKEATSKSITDAVEALKN